MHLLAQWRVYAERVLDVLFPLSRRGARLRTLSLSDIPLSPLVVHKQSRDIITLFEYEHPVIKDLVQSAKFENNAHAQHLLSAAIHDFLIEECAEQALLGTAIDYVIPIPLSRMRLRERGYNQVAKVLEAALVDAPLPPLSGDIFIRTKETKAQATLPRHERFLNVRGAFAIAPTHRENIKGKKVLLVDDVVTTGATINEAAETLENEGAVVISLAFARA